MPDIDLIDKSLNRENTQNYHLSIQSDLNGFSFCILDVKKNIYLGFRHYNLEKTFSIDDYVDRLTEVFNEDDLLGWQYDSSSFIYLTQKSTLIPESFFDKSNLKDYFEFNQNLNELDEINYNYLDEINAYNIFAVPHYIVNLVLSRLNNVSFFHQATPFIKIIFENIVDKESKSACVNLNSRFADIAVVSENKLCLYNTFQFQNETDLLYFVLYIYKQLDLKTGKNKLFIAGEHSDNIKYYSALKKYITTVRFLEPFTFIFADILEKLTKYKYLNLFNSFRCV